jgi:multidrug efflux pump subunit AcrA (membrane-fusion protein)
MNKYWTALLMVFLMACKEEKEQVKPSLKTVTESIYASGKIKSEQQYQVYAAVSGILKQVLVEEGQTVSKGQPIFIIENKTSELNVENARLAMELAKENYQGKAARLKELELQINLAREKMFLDSIQFIRQNNLWSQGIGTQQELDGRKIAYESSKNNYLSLLQQYQQANLNLKNELQRAQNNYLISLKSKGDFTVRSEIDGKVYEINKQKGELVGPQQSLAIIGSANNFVIEMQVDEYDIVRVKVGQEVLLSMDSYKGQIFKAKVSRILPLMNERSRTFTVEALFDTLPPVIYPNLTAEANIIVRTKEKALTIPRSYLTEKNEVILSDGQHKKIETGIADLQKIEVLSGLDTATVIIKP